MALRVCRALLGLQAPQGLPGPLLRLWDRQARPGLQGRLGPLLASPDQLDHLALDRLAPLVPQELHRLWLDQLGLQAPLVQLAMIQLCPARLDLLEFPDQLAQLARLLLLPVPRVQQELVAPPAPQAQILPLQARLAPLA